LRQFITFTTGALIALLIGSHFAPGQTTTKVISTVDDTVHVNQVITTIDLEHLRDTLTINPDLDASLAAECAYAIQRQTDELLKGIVIHVERWWQGDSCAAYDHLVRHGWY
jgi:hypothetical protein